MHPLDVRNCSNSLGDDVTHASLFSGIDGFGLAAEWCGWENIFQVEIEDYPTKVLERHYPNVKRYRDIKEFDGRPYRGTIDVLSGGFPCQPYSVAGKRKGKEDDRALWPEMLRVIQEIGPTWVVGENVAGFIEMGLEQSCLDLESEGYEVWPLVIPACAVEAPHRRDRVWIIAYNERFAVSSQINERQINRRKRTQMGYKRRTSGGESDSNGDGKHRKKHKRGNQFRCEGEEIALGRSVHEPDWQENWIEVATRLCRVDDGVPNRVHRIKALGNAIVPQVAYEIFKAIDEAS